MKKKLTITVDDVVLRRAEGFGRRRGVSLSKLIEESLRPFREPETESFTERWKGRFQPANREDDRYIRLVRKFQ